MSFFPFLAVKLNYYTQLQNKEEKFFQIIVAPYRINIQYLCCFHSHTIHHLQTTMMTSIDEMPQPQQQSIWEILAMGRDTSRSTSRHNTSAGTVGDSSANAVFYSAMAIFCGLVLAFSATRSAGVSMPTPIEPVAILGEFFESDLLQNRPTDVSIVIIGDSVSRYGYLSLVYFLRWGRWFEPDLEINNLVNENSFKSPFHDDLFGEFYFQSSRLLEPYELCDCYKDTSFDENKALGRHIIENRYYHDPELNNTVTFIHAYGHENVIHGRIKADETHASKWDWHKSEKKLVQNKFTDTTWHYKNWAEVITNYVRHLQPHPDFVIVNAGQWSNQFGPKDKSVSQEFADALVQGKFKGAIWKTTTHKKGGHAMNADVPKTDDYMCRLLGACFNISWTQNLMDHLYWDDRHFYEPVYRVLNEDMLQVMGYLPKGYAKFDRTKLFKRDAVEELIGEVNWEAAEKQEGNDGED
jgi:hypothetical protein